MRERPLVFFRVSDYAWIEAVCRYVVEPRMAGRVKNKLIRKVLDRLNAEPDCVRFPKGDAPGHCRSLPVGTLCRKLTVTSECFSV